MARNDDGDGIGAVGGAHSTHRAESSDGREWGLVPERLMLGRALVVYFPFNRAGTIK